MARNPLIEAIHLARYDLETCARHQRSSFQRKLEELLRQALDRARSTATSDHLLDALFDDYREFKRAKKREEWARLPMGRPKR
jgi:hypothetical protein